MVGGTYHIASLQDFLTFLARSSRGEPSAFNAGFRALGLPWRSTHICRHSFGTLALKATRDLSCVQAAMGHRDIRETQRYAKLIALADGVANHKIAELIGFRDFTRRL